MDNRAKSRSNREKRHRHTRHNERLKAIRVEASVVMAAAFL